MPALDEILAQKLHEMAATHRLRRMVETTPQDGRYVLRHGHKLLNFSGNDYFGLAHHPALHHAATEAMARYGTGATSSRLVAGNHPLYTALEQALASFHGAEAACVFASGFAANLGCITALMGKGDLILADKLAHACLLDGARLSGATLLRFPHQDVAQAHALLSKHRAHYRHCLLVTESIFSMDGDAAPLRALQTLTEQSDCWLMVDDAHGFALPNLPHINPDIRTGTLSKGLASIGGYACGSERLIRWLHTAARPLIYSTALPPACLATALAALDRLVQEPERRARPLQHALRLTHALQLPQAVSPIVPILVGESSAALHLAEQLQQDGLYLGAIRPPTVPEGTARLRLTFSAAHEEPDIQVLIDALEARLPTPPSTPPLNRSQTP